MLLPKRQYFPGVCSWICCCNQSDALLGCKQTHLYSGAFLRYPELNSISETWEKHPQPCAELSEGTWTLEFHHSTMASCCSPGVQGSWLRDWTPACKALFGTDHSHGIGKVLIWEYTRLDVPYWKFGFPGGMVPWGKTLPMPQDILSVLCGFMLLTLWYVKCTLWPSEAFPKSFQASCYLFFW